MGKIIGIDLGTTIHVLQLWKAENLLLLQMQKDQGLHRQSLHLQSQVNV